MNRVLSIQKDTLKFLQGTQWVLSSQVQSIHLKIFIDIIDTIIFLKKKSPKTYLIDPEQKDAYLTYRMILWS